MPTKKNETLPHYWSTYWAINKHRIGKKPEFTDKISGEQMIYEFVGAEIMRGSLFLQVFSSIMWMSPALLVVLLSLLFIPYFSMSLFVGILIIIAYHFAAMYYIIRGPHIRISEVKKKGIFSRK
jgi:hypothetical protein